MGMDRENMDFFDTIANRYCYRDDFKDIPVPREDLEKIVGAGLKAPSGKNEQTTSFIIVDDAGLLEKIGRMHTMSAMRQARAMIACIVDKEPEAIYEGYSFQVEDCAAAVENLLLAITSLGYASVWIDGWLRCDDRAAQIGQLLGIPEDKIIRILLPIGVPTAEGPRKDKKPFNERVSFNHYGDVSPGDN